MAAIHPIELRYRVTPVDNGTFGVLGDISQTEVGMWRLHWVPDASFAGDGLAILGRAAPVDDSGGANFGTVPYRRVQVAGQASDLALVQTGGVAVPITSDSIIYVPASGLTIAVEMGCTAGFGYLYSLPLIGHPGF